VLRRGGRLNIFFRASAGSVYQRGLADPVHRLATQQIILRLQKWLSMDFGTVIENFERMRIRCVGMLHNANERAFVINLKVF
jgi:hypothetical protein